jgi:cephalosporin-C deacetylase-like acetyl esterase
MTKNSHADGLNRFGRMVQEYFVSQVRQAEAKGLERKGALKSRADAQAYVKRVRELARECFGPFPERTPLNARMVGRIKRDIYDIEKVIFESRPGLLVTGNLYLPKGGKSGKKPAVLGLCGHSHGGKTEQAYQSFCQGLARKGYVVFIIDPIGQGERLQYLNAEGKSEVGNGVLEHLLGGNQQFLIGEFFGSWRAWDAMRALDYLLDRPEVDRAHVGVTGNSGGGTMTTWICALEERITMAAPGCFVTTFRRNLENELPQDTEQHPPKALALGLDHDDFLAAMAPRPLRILAQEKDFFDVRGAQETYGRLKRLYKLLGHEENVSLFIGPHGHGYKQENREAMYAWFNKATGVNADGNEPQLTIEEDKTLWCTPKGQVGLEGSKSLFQFTKERSKALAQARRPLEGEALKRAVAETLKVSPSKGEVDYRILRPIERSAEIGGRKWMTPYLLQSEPGIDVMVYGLTREAHVSRPTPGKKAILYVAHQSSDAELTSETLVRELVDADPDAALFACDVRGTGESRPTTTGSGFATPYGADYFYAIHSIMLDRPYVGQKTSDLLRAIDWLAGLGFTEIHLAALGWGTLPATFASVLHDGVTRVTLKNAPKSYSDIAETERYDWPLSSFVPGILKTFDLTDCYFHGLAKKGLRRI